LNIAEMTKPETGIAEYNATAAALAELRARLSGVAYDVTTGKGMDVARRDRAEVRDLRVALEKKRVELKAPALERSRLIDAEAKRITADLLELETPIDEQIKAEEQRKEREKQDRINAEFGRVQAIHEAIAEIGLEATIASGKPSTHIRGAQHNIRTQELDPLVFQELMPQAIAARDAAVAKLEIALAAALHNEAEAERMAAERRELEQLRAAAAEQKRKDEAAALEARKAEDARIAAERKAQEAEMAAARAEQKRLDAESAAKRAEDDRIAREARQAEQKRIDDERAELKRQQDAADAERRAAILKAEADEKKLRDAAPAMLLALRTLRDMKLPAKANQVIDVAIDEATV